VFYENGEISIKKYWNNNSLILKKFHQNGRVLSEGKVQDSLKIGWWKYYTDTGKLKHKLEFISTRENKEYVNQAYYYNNLGEILKDSSNYYTLSFPDTISLNKLYKGFVKLNPDLSRENDFHMVYFNTYDSQDKIIAIDSTYGKNEKAALIWAKFRKTGINKIKGYILEKKLVTEPNEKDTTMVNIYNLEYKMYFNKDVYVIDDKKVYNSNKKFNANQA
jgi:hypothetical protein